MKKGLEVARVMDPFGSKEGDAVDLAVKKLSNMTHAVDLSLARLQQAWLPCLTKNQLAPHWFLMSIISLANWPAVFEVLDDMEHRVRFAAKSPSTIIHEETLNEIVKCTPDLRVCHKISK